MIYYNDLRYYISVDSLSKQDPPNKTYFSHSSKDK